METTTLRRFYSTYKLIIVFSLSLGFFGGAFFAQAQPVTFTVEGSDSVTVVNGQAVLFEWSASSICEIDNGIGPVPTAHVYNSMIVMPPESAVTVYTLSCVDGSSSSVTVTTLPEPEVTVGFSPNPITADSVAGELGTISWTSEFATHCGDVIVTDMFGGVQIITNNDNRTSDAGEDFLIKATSTVYLECWNELTDINGDDMITVSVIALPPAPPPSVTIEASDNPAIYSSAWGAGEVEINDQGEYVDSCTRSYVGPSEPISFSGHAWTTEPEWSLSVNRVYGITGTTTFVTECTRTSDGQTASSSVTVDYSPTGAALEPPEVQFIDVSNPTSTPVVDAVSGEGFITFGYESSNANQCYYTARTFAGTPYMLSGWSDQWPSVLSRSSMTLTLATSTILEIICERTFDGSAASATLTISLLQGAPAPDPMVALAASSTSVAPVTGETFAHATITWQSLNTTYCGIRQATSIDGSTYSFSSYSGTEHSVALTISTTTDFYVECGRTGDSLTGSATLRVDYLDSSVTPPPAGECYDGGGSSITIPLGYLADPVTYQCVQRVSEIEPILLGVSPVGSWIPDPETGTYDNVEIRTVFRNNGPHDALAGDDISYRFALDYDNDSNTSFDDEDSYVNQFGDGLSAGASSPTLRVFSNVPFGTHRIEARINLDPTNVYEGGGSALDNNVIYENFVAPVPPPELELTTDRRVVRSGQTVLVSWDVPVSYELQCQVVGPGINRSFNTQIEMSSQSEVSDPLAYSASPLSLAAAASGAETSDAIGSTVVFTLTCTEPTTGTVFEQEALVEVEPEYEER